MGPAIELDSRTSSAIDGRHIRALTFQDVRLEYVSSVLRRLGIEPDGRSALVVGSGRGLLARGLAGLGMNVVALDPSAGATAMAREADGGGVEYATAPAEEPGQADAAFDVVFYADTFEITEDLERVVSHAARLLRPDGVLFYDTVNRTPVSRLIYLGAFQALPFTRIMPPGRYSAARLRTPEEVTAALAAHGLRNEDVCSFKPKNVLDLVRATVARRKGKIGDDAIPGMTGFVLEPDGKPIVTYLGYARPRG
ncbi:methyltransferase domain-containing protein [Actinomadura barringtoniae]|uniref:Methyltransferase domain-containing protein n=1 Tax=Actinomadura barringtoniae TaxID=1427535 RepID=A0A939PL31_9ACTN|nr:methyltransferase domain-containing protein [Actinomadura barringtoniae]MBO2451129.1 methyltransferase domain-containing protein [Actinomadura barringtoniae]